MHHIAFTWGNGFIWLIAMHANFGIETSTVRHVTAIMGFKVWSWYLVTFAWNNGSFNEIAMNAFISIDTFAIFCDDFIFVVAFGDVM